MAGTNFQTVDEYIASFPADVREVLQQVRRTIKEAVPEARERISYQMPAFTLEGNLIYFGAFKSHIGVYGTSGAAEAFRQELAPYLGPKGNLRFPFGQPMPLFLIGEVVKFRANENIAKARAKRPRARA